ncbi:MAG: phosphopantothenoylcysteine decarboxylase [Candidatus Dormibacteria bacterium]
MSLRRGVTVPDLAGQRLVVTAGGTREPIDPVRYLGNRSSGKMGNALAIAARAGGASVLLITTVEPPVETGLEVAPVETATQMHHAVVAAMQSADALIMAAAVADYRPRDVATRKLKKSERRLVLELVPTLDILSELRSHPRHGEVLIVGFAAETDDLEANAKRKLEGKGLDLIVLNDVAAAGIGMGTDDNAVTILDRSGVVAQVPRAPKSEVAHRILDVVAARLSGLRGAD